MVRRLPALLTDDRVPCAHGCDRALEFAILTQPGQRDPALVAEIKTMGDAQVEAWAADMTSKGLDGEGMVAYAKELVAKYADQ